MRPAENKGLTLSYERKELPSIEIDIDRFRQVMVNFIGNAIKYTPGGEVRVMTSVDDTPSSYACKWSGRQASILRPPASEAGTLTGLSYTQVIWRSREDSNSNLPRS